MCLEIRYSGISSSLRHRHRQRGLGLPVAIFLLVILALLAVAISDLNTLSAQSTVLQTQSQRAYLAARSALQRSAARLKPVGQPVQSCSSVGTGITYATDGLRGCSASLVCREDRLGALTVFTLEATGSCGSDNSLALHRLSLRVQ